MKFFLYIIHFLWQIADRIWLKNSNYWAFSTHYIATGDFFENQRAIFEEIKADNNIKKIIFFRGEKINFSLSNAYNYKIVRLGSLYSFYILMKCKVIFITNTIAMEYSIRWDNKFLIIKPCLKNRVVVNLGHGVSIKKILSASNQKISSHVDRNSYRKKERKDYKGIIATSNIDRCIMAAMYYPAQYNQTWLTGMPRSDFLLKDEKNLPEYIQHDIKFLKKLTKGKRIITYMPTYRQTKLIENAYYYSFSKNEINRLKSFLNKNNAIFLFRLHYFNNDSRNFNLLDYVDNELIFNISNDIVRDVTALVRLSDVIISDYSSVLADGLFLDKKLIGFCYDESIYSESQEGLVYDLRFIYGEYIYSCFDEVIDSLTYLIFEKNSYHNNVAKNLLYKYIDTNNSNRVIGEVKKVLKYN